MAESKVHPVRSTSNPALVRRLAAVGCGQLHVVPVGQQRPPQTPLTQSCPVEQTCPSGQRHARVAPPLQIRPPVHALPQLPQSEAVSRALHWLEQQP